MTESASPPLRPALRLDATAATLLDPATRSRHAVPGPLRARLRAAVESGRVERDDPELALWLEARHLVASERALAVEAWAAARGDPPRPEAAAAPPRALALVGAPRFTCHGCGACCRGFGDVPVTEAERARVLERAADLAPHVATPAARWFVAIPEGERPRPDRAFALAHLEDGACVFLDGEGLCAIHRHIGEERKPHTCRAFPLQFTDRPDRRVATVRVHCESLARSRDDGAPLSGQLDWIRSVVADAPAAVVPALVRVEGDALVPFALARRVEAAALALLAGAPSVEAALLALRDVLAAVARALGGGPPDVARLDAAWAAIALPLDALEAARGPIVPGRALAALGGWLAEVLGAAPAVLPHALPGSEARGPARDRLFLDALRALYAGLAARLGWPPRDDGTAAALAEAERALAVDPASEDAAVVDFLREALAQLVGASGPLAHPAGLLHGYALVALTHVVARFAARILAARRGAARASREDWNLALAAVDSGIRSFDRAAGQAAIRAVFADLFFVRDLPS